MKGLRLEEGREEGREGGRKGWLGE